MDTNPASNASSTDATRHNSSATADPSITAAPSAAAGRDTEADPGQADDTPATGRARQPIRVLRDRAGRLTKVVGAARRSTASTDQSTQRSTPTMVRRGAAALIATAAATAGAAVAGWLWRRRTADRRRTRLQRATRLARQTAARVRARLPI